MAIQELTKNIESSVQSRAQALFVEHRQRIFKYTDRLFVGLMIFQWIAGIVVALEVSPKTWIGAASQTHVHVWIAIFLGGGIAAAPVVLGIFMPGETITRYCIAIAQMLFSALFIHLTGGRIETHFHVFGSLAFLAFYRDWKVFIPATIVVGLDHMLRGIFWPQSVFGVLTVSPWRWVEHVAWVIFEDIFLIASCQRSVKEMWDIAERTAQLEANNQLVEIKVKERTEKLIDTQKKLKQANRLADIGTLAATVAHELRNPLASMTLATRHIKKNAKDPDIDKYLVSIDKKVAESNQIIDNLLFYSRLKPPHYERVNIFDILEECSADILEKNGGKETTEIKELDSIKGVLVEADSTQIKEVFNNILNNAHDALPSSKGQIKITAENEEKFIKVAIEDNGTGIDKEIRDKIFEPFFTTKAKGTGLGLPICWQIIDMHGGDIEIKSEPGQGVSVIVRLPKEEKNKRANG